MKIATWNVNSINVRLPHILTWLAQAQPHIVALQETKVVDQKFPHAELADKGFNCIVSGQKTYNGVAILTCLPASDVITDMPGLIDPQRRILAASIGDVRIINIYVPNGASVGSEKYTYKLNWLINLTQFIQQQLTQYEKLIVLGDFNIAPGDEDVHDPVKWAGHILCSDAERAAFQDLLALGLIDVFRQFSQPEKSFSWWDYRQLALQRNRGLRIDHILASTVLATHCQSCHIDKDPRKWQRPSDHAPVMAVFE